MLLVVGAAVAAVACSSGSSRSAFQDLRSRVGGIRAETVRHGTQVAAATDPGAIRTLEADHADWMTGPMAMMSDDMGAMALCHDSMGHHVDEDGMWSSMESMSDECAEHHASMTSAGTVDAMHGEEGRHQDAMGAMLDGMESWLDQTGAMMGTMTCTSDDGMGHGGGM
jgi:hypothetical protein